MALVEILIGECSGGGRSRSQLCVEWNEFCVPVAQKQVVYSTPRFLIVWIPPRVHDSPGIFVQVRHRIISRDFSARNSLKPIPPSLLKFGFCGWEGSVRAKILYAILGVE